MFDSFRRDKTDPNQYIGKRRYGGNPDDSDEDSDNENDPDLMDKTPGTKRRLMDEKSKSVVNKLGPCNTFLTLVKGFVASAVLYLPKSFVNGGYGFSILALIVSCVVTIHCAMLLLQVRAATKSSSYSELGLKLYGRFGKYMIDFSLCLS